MRLYHGTKHKKDIDNYSKIVFDSLNGIVWEDDVQIQKMLVAYSGLIWTLILVQYEHLFRLNVNGDSGSI